MWYPALNLLRFAFRIALFVYFPLTAQSVYVDLKLQTYTSHISKFNRVEMEAKLKDTIMNAPKRYSFRGLHLPTITFDSNTPHDYIIEIKVIDTVMEQKALATKLYGRVYERNISSALMPKWDWFMAGYSDLDGIVQNEEDVLDNYFSWIPIHLRHYLKLIPHRKSSQIQAFNISEDSARKMENFYEFFPHFDYPIDTEDSYAINHLFTNVLHNQQEFYWATRSRRKGYFNLYEKSVSGFTSNPIHIMFSITSVSNNYKIILKVDKNNTLLKTSMIKVPDEIVFSQEQLLNAPTQVMDKLNNLLGSFFRINLD